LERKQFSLDGYFLCLSSVENCCRSDGCNVLPAVRRKNQEHHQFEIDLLRRRRGALERSAERNRKFAAVARGCAFRCFSGGNYFYFRNNRRSKRSFDHASKSSGQSRPDLRGISEIQKIR